MTTNRRALAPASPKRLLRAAADRGLFSYPIEQFSQSFDHPDPARAGATTIVSALDELVLTQESPPPEGSVHVAADKHLTVYADRVVIRGPLTLPGRRVEIVARELSAVKDGRDRPPQLDVSGGPAAAPLAPQPQASRASDGGEPLGNARTGQPGTAGAAGRDGAHGAPGAHGGAITLRVERFAPRTALRLHANGGAGGNGQAGQVGQDAGHGGRGRDGLRPSRFDQRGEKGTAGGDGGRGGRGGNGGNGGEGGRGGRIDVGVTANARDVSLAFAANGGSGGDGAAAAAGGNGGNYGPQGRFAGRSGEASAGAGGDGGVGGNGGTPGPGGVCEINEHFEILVGRSFSGGSSGRPGRSARGGRGGEGAAGAHGADGFWPTAQTAKPAEPGAAGHMGTRPPVDYFEFANRLPASLLAMQLQKAKLLRLTLDPLTDPAGLERLVVLLRWLQQVTVYLTPSRRPNGFPPDKVAAFAAIYGQAAVMAFQLTLKHDAFGHAPSYVPQGSYNFYDRLLDSMIGANGSFLQIEAAHRAYFDALQQKKATLAQLDTARSRGEQQLVTLRQLRDEALSTVKSLVPVIDDAHAAIEHQFGIMKAALAGLEMDIARIAGANCVFDNIVKGLNLMHRVSDSNDIALAASVAGYGQKAFVGGLTLIGGLESIPTDKLVKQLSVLGRDVKTLREGFDASRGIITTSEPEAYKLLVAESEFDALVAPYLRLPAAAAAQEAMHLYVTLVQRRNADILRFNTAATQFAAALSEVQQGESELAAVDAALAARSDPALPALAAFVASLYHDARQQVIEALYLASRSFAFWSLRSDYSAFRTFVGLTNPSGITGATLAAATQKLRTSLAQAIEDFGTGPQEFPAPRKAGITVHFTPREQAALLATFKRRNARGLHQVSFLLPAALPQSSQAATPFFGLANIRLRKVRAWLHGAKTADGVLDVAVRHGGEETIVDPHGTAHVFTHEPITKRFRFECARAGEPSAVVLDGDFDASGKSAAYAQPGPFTTWTITVAPEHNTGLNVDAVTALTLEFFGNAYAFPTRKVRTKKAAKPGSNRRGRPANKRG